MCLICVLSQRVLAQYIHSILQEILKFILGLKTPTFQKTAFPRFVCCHNRDLDLIKQWVGRLDSKRSVWFKPISCKNKNKKKLSQVWHNPAIFKILVNPHFLIKILFSNYYCIFQCPTGTLQVLVTEVKGKVYKEIDRIYLACFSLQASAKMNVCKAINIFWCL